MSEIEVKAGSQSPSPETQFPETQFPETRLPDTETTYVIVDLETAGGRPADAEITEIGAILVRGGQIIGEFQTLCNPEVAIPWYITNLTGIRNSHLVDAPSVATGISQFLDFAGFDSFENRTLVAHNAPFDVGFLRHGCRKFDLVWPEPKVLDTVRLARKVLEKDEVVNRKLGTLAHYFQVPSQPTHRALDDARATHYVLQHLLAREMELVTL